MSGSAGLAGGRGGRKHTLSQERPRTPSRLPAPTEAPTPLHFAALSRTCPIRMSLCQARGTSLRAPGNKLFCSGTEPGRVGGRGGFTSPPHSVQPWAPWPASRCFRPRPAKEETDKQRRRTPSPARPGPEAVTQGLRLRRAPSPPASRPLRRQPPQPATPPRAGGAARLEGRGAGSSEPGRRPPISSVGRGAMSAQGPGPARFLSLGNEHPAAGSGAGRGSGQSRERPTWLSRGLGGLGVLGVVLLRLLLLHPKPWASVGSAWAGNCHWGRAVPTRPMTRARATPTNTAA